MTKTEQLVREYETLIKQIFFWDTQSWQTSQFFSAIEGAFFAGVGWVLYTEFKTTGPSGGLVVFLLALASVFNLALCTVWFRVNQASRAWLDVRIKRAEMIEKEPGIEIQTLTFQRNEFLTGQYEGHNTSKLERQIPTLFAVAWILMSVVIVLAQWY